MTRPAQVVIGLLWLSIVACAFFAGRASATSRTGQHVAATFSEAPRIGETRQGLARIREQVPRSGGASPSPTATVRETSPQPTPGPARATVPVSVSGIASWGDGWTGVVTRFPRGTPIRVCGPLGCWSGRSVGYGPAVWTGRIADLSRAVFSEICGDPAMGLCRVVLWDRP